jgi:multidrug resistance efflux pump
VNYSMRAVLARYETLEAARAAREEAVAEWRKHDAAVREAESRLREAEKAREEAWLACLRDAAGRH